MLSKLTWGTTSSIGEGAELSQPHGTQRHEQSLLPLVTDRLCLEQAGRRLINDISLTVADGGITTIMGPNGAGKSLLLRLLHGIITPTSGNITWAGQPLTEPVRKRQAMVFQQPVMLRRSVRSNIDFALRLRGPVKPDARDRALALANLESYQDQPARSLSGGEQQRLALARALCLEPAVLFLDEPTASLDPASVQVIEDAVKQARTNGTKIIFVTHDIAQARRLGGEIIFLHHGCVLEQTPAEQFFELPQSQPARNYLAGRIVL